MDNLHIFMSSHIPLSAVPIVTYTNYKITKQKEDLNISEGRGHWIVNYTGTQSFTTLLSHFLGQKLWGLFIKFCLVGSKI